MNSLVLTRSATTSDIYHLALRTHDLSGTSYETILRLPARQAAAIAGDHTGISFRLDAPAGMDDVEKHALRIERVPHRHTNTRAWQVRIGGELVTAVKDGQEIPVRLSDAHVLTLQAERAAEFEPGEPDWERRDVENLEDRAIDMMEAARKAMEAHGHALRKWRTRQMREAGAPEGAPQREDPPSP